MSAGYTKEQLQIAQEFDTNLAAARQAVRTDPKSAITQLNTLLGQLDQNKFLEHHRPELLVQLGQASLAAGIPKKAAEYFQQRLLLSDDECKPDSSYPAECGRARTDLGMAKLLAGEPDGLQLLAQAVEDHRRQIKLDGKPEELQHFVLSEAALVLGSAYARAGKAADARAALEESRSAANKIIAVADVQQSLRDEAKQFVSVIDRLETSLPK